MSVAMIGPKFYGWDKNGKPLAFGKLYTYQARTNNPKDTYQSEDQVVVNTNPVILNGEGYANVYLSGSYKMVLKDEDENEIWSADPVSSSEPSEWVLCLTAQYLSSASFKVNGNFTAQYEQGRRVRIDNNTSEYSYATIISSIFSAGETTITIDDPVVTTGLVEVCHSIIGLESVNYGAVNEVLINDLSQTINLSVAEYKAFTKELPLGKKVYVTDRNADFVVVSTGIGNDSYIIESADSVNIIALKNNPALSLTAFGVSTSNTASLNHTYYQLALDYQATLKFELLLPPEVYDIDGSLVIKHIGSKITGVSMELSGINQVNNTLSTPTLKTDEAITRNFGCVLQDFFIQQPDNTTGTGLQINNPNRRHVLERVKVLSGPGERSDGIGIHIFRNSGAALVDGYFTTTKECFVDKMNQGIVIEGQDPGGAIKHWVTSTTTTDCTDVGVYLKNTAAVTIQGCHIEINGTGIRTENSGDCTFNDLYMERNALYGWDHISGDANKMFECRIAATGDITGGGTDPLARCVRIRSGEFNRVKESFFNETNTSFDVQIDAGAGGTIIRDCITKLRDSAGGWNSNGPRIDNSGQGTIADNDQLTSGGTYQHTFSDGNYLANGFNMVEPGIIGGTNNARIYAGNGNPEGIVTASRGSIYLRTNGGGGFTFYVKETGDATNTGWAAK